MITYVSITIIRTDKDYLKMSTVYVSVYKYYLAPVDPTLCFLYIKPKPSLLHFFNL
jgi:hypothetical protein